MEPETETVIDVEAEPIDNFEPDSTEEWYSAVQTTRPKKFMNFLSFPLS